MKPSPLTVSLADWPRVLVRGELLTLPMPREGNSGHHVCAPAVPSECRACRCRRDASDRQAVRDMFSATGRVAPNFKREELEWEW